ncbi:hypothetical protein M2451_002611 [Dysgonomonas sp. PFB1-18]|uniref:hypothetical protein n=1 Tax=unclassified Dysgonomonas TaxID=2630389 RepID=UPI0024756327|nr:MULTISPECIES: hypothetical protein [unclassified Dysgonomonas]MDH6308092.1 hypothetical protein [Dysgonomonas sp. PF1-14]MDH6339631.1 hypothetical protein [Dysgonomonas sp. PF1-16]MDH6381282.1 hypothetical protein [Dysgonomonas sp. PFB1-18]MDH6398494.1 hypothetical protein [Dysgonomonas sp. PF1-23]
MHYKQEYNYGCGLYTIANVLQDGEIITPRNIEASKNGNNLGQLNKWLWERDYDIWIGMLRYNNQEPIEIFDLKPDFEADERVLWYPFMIVVISTSNRNHMIGCRYMRDRSIIVHDSLQDTEMVFKSFDLFEEHYKGRVLSFECFYTLKNETVAIVKT